MKLLIFLLLFSIFSCNRKPEITQTVRKESCLENTYSLITSVWSSGHETIEYQIWHTLSQEKIDSTKKADYIKALPFLERVKNCK